MPIPWLLTLALAALALAAAWRARRWSGTVPGLTAASLALGGLCLARPTVAAHWPAAAAWYEPAAVASWWALMWGLLPATAAALALLARRWRRNGGERWRIPARGSGCTAIVWVGGALTEVPRAVALDLDLVLVYGGLVVVSWWVVRHSAAVVGSRKEAT